MKDPVQICLSGLSNQGLITAGVILAEAALLEGKNVVQTQHRCSEDYHCLEISEAEVIVSEKKVTFPRVTHPDLLLCLSEEAFEKYFSLAELDTIVILDSSTIRSKVPTGPLIYRFPITETAVRVGDRVVANVVALGVLNSLMGLATPMSLRQAVAKHVPERFRTLNEQALIAGEELVH